MTNDKEERMLTITRGWWDENAHVVSVGKEMLIEGWLPSIEWDDLPLAPKHTETEYNILLATAQMFYRRLDCVPWCQRAGGGDDCVECPSGTEKDAWTKPCSKCGHYHHCLETILKLDARINELEKEKKYWYQHSDNLNDKGLDLQEHCHDLEARIKELEEERDVYQKLYIRKVSRK
jgi:hypothetical protein